ncbi:phosphoglycerate kinase [Candidatus Azambacteria bacterium]|nr:phosphoglycerate kinase [Candidatus Azambacteria bacterium]
MRLRTVDKTEVKNKKVLVRVDFNVAMENGAIKDDFRIQRVVPTLRQLLTKRAKVILMTHFGRPQEARTEKERRGLGLKKVAQRLEKDIGHKVHFVSECVGERAQRAASALKSGEILLLENLRFHQEEERNDEVFASKLAALADIYVNEAFSVSHRAHASVSAITRFLPSYAGPEFAREARILHHAYMKPKMPLVMVMGGAKVETKAKLIKRFFNKADNILLGGIIANAVLQIQGIAIGRSKLDFSTTQKLKGLDWMSTKLHLPVDVVVAKEISESAWVKTVAVGNVKDDEIILDIGVDTVKLFSKIAATAGTIIWNGPLGYSELAPFAVGTTEFAKAVAVSKAFKIVGGGESVSILDKLHLSHTIDFISTGGGAMLEFLAGDPMPGIEALKNK